MTTGPSDEGASEAARRHARVSELLARLLTLPESERVDAARRACPDEPDVEAELLSLLDHVDDDDDDHEPPRSEVGSAIERALAARTTAAAAEDVSGDLRIGGHRILRLLGEGGMGRVYEAEQETPRRRVALKLIRGVSASDEGLRRFAREADVLARLQHPGICQVHEVGRSESGLPFMTMELIDGLPLLEHARSRGLDRAARLVLASKICDAVAHAHRRGIVHRDLKPDNILVTAEGQPKIVDFGIARTSDLTVGNTLLTATGAVVGTVAYMSPEQAAGSREIDARSDVFSLGVICFELLTDRRPLSLDGLTLAQALHEIQRSDLSVAGRTDASLRGDLATLLGKAMDPEPSRRYPSASEMADDIRRHLDHEPIVARPPSLRYRVAKFSRRHRTLVVAAALVFAALGLGLLLAVQQAGRAERASRQATERALAAERASYRATMRSAENALQAGRMAAVRRELAAAPEAQRSWEHAHLTERLRHAEGRRLHAGDLLDVEYLPDGRVVAIDVADGRPASLLVFDAHGRAAPQRLPLDGRRLVVPRGLARPALAAALSRGGRGGSYEVLDAATGERLLTASACDQGTSDGVRPREPAILSPSGRRALLQAESGPRACDLETGTWLGPDLDVGLASPGFRGEDLILGADNDRARLIDARTGETTWSVSRGVDGTSSAALSPNGASLYTLGLITDPTLRRWSIEDGKVLAERRMRGNVGGGPFAFSGDGRRVALTAQAFSLRVLSADLAEDIATLSLPAHRACRLALDGEGHRLAAAIAGGDAAGLRTWDLDAPGARALLSGHETYVYDVDFSPDGRWLASVSWDGTVRTWDAGRGTSVAAFAPQGFGRGHRVRWSADGRRLVTTSSSGMRVLDADSGEVVAHRDGLGEVFGMETNPRLGVVVVSHGDGLSLLDDESLESLASPPGRGGVDWSPDGRWLAVASEEGGCRVIDPIGGSERWSRPGRGEPPPRLRFSRDGTEVAVLDGTRYVVLDADSGQELRSVACWDGGTSFEWTPDGRRFVEGGGAGGIHFVDAEAGGPVLTLEEHAAYVIALDFSPDGLTLATASGDGDVRLWSARPRSPEAR